MSTLKLLGKEIPTEVQKKIMGGQSYTCACITSTGAPSFTVFASNQRSAETAARTACGLFSTVTCRQNLM